MWTRRQIAVVLATVTVILSTATLVFVASQPAAAGLVPFGSYSELSTYLTNARGSYDNGRLATGYGPMFGSPVSAAPNAGGAAAPTAPAYSGTNVQVAGVDELDMVKTDGAYLYVASGNQTVIFQAYPATDLHVVSRITLANLSVSPAFTSWDRVAGLFLQGSTLVVVADSAGYYGGPVPLAAPGLGTAVGGTYPIVAAPERSSVLLFDVSDPASPVLEHDVAITGTASTGRMVGSTVYLVATQYIAESNGTYARPRVCADGTCTDLPADQVYRDPQSVDAWDYTNLLAVNVTAGKSSAMAIVTGGMSLLYMSPTAMYLAFYKWQLSPEGVAGPLMPARIGGSWTTIYKLRADGLEIRAVGSGDVPGSVRDQYSLDEWQGYLRVATTVRDFSGNATSIRNDVYVFDGAMERVGSVTGIAPGESIYAVRFVEDRAYVVTFRQIDPLFVIDLSDPTSPHVDGFVEMPGFSEYLYPIDAGHLIGVGKDATATEAEFAWYEGLKISLYNVTDASAPAETANVSIGDRGTGSAVLQDPHAFLYVPGARLLVIPVDLAIVNQSAYPYGVPPWAWGDVVWQGAYVYRVNESSGFEYVGRVAHGNGTVNATYGWYGSPTQILRSLYIGDVLYTISETEVLASSLADLSTIQSVVYATPSSVCPYCYPVPIVVA